MAEVDHAAQRNAAAAEQLTATATEMAKQAEKLERLMDFFKGKSGAAPARSTAHALAGFAPRSKAAPTQQKPVRAAEQFTRF